MCGVSCTVLPLFRFNVFELVAITGANSSGSILNRFSKDMDNIDRMLVRTINSALSHCFIAFGGFIAVCATMPLLLVPFTPMVIALFVMVRHQLNAKYGLCWRMLSSFMLPCVWVSVCA